MDCRPPGILQARILEWLPCPPPGIFHISGIEPESLRSPVLAGSFFTTSSIWELGTILERVILEKLSREWTFELRCGRQEEVSQKRRKSVQAECSASAKDLGLGRWRNSESPVRLEMSKQRGSAGDEV